MMPGKIFKGHSSASGGLSPWNCECGFLGNFPNRSTCYSCPRSAPQSHLDALQAFWAAKGTPKGGKAAGKGRKGVMDQMQQKGKGAWPTWNQQQAKGAWGPAPTSSTPGTGEAVPGYPGSQSQQDLERGKLEKAISEKKAFEKQCRNNGQVTWADQVKEEIQALQKNWRLPDRFSTDSQVRVRSTKMPKGRPRRMQEGSENYNAIWKQR